MILLPDAATYGEKVTAIVYCDQDQVNGKRFLKYKHVDNTPRGIRTFLNFAKQFPGARHVNFYSKANYQFIEQHKF